MVGNVKNLIFNKSIPDKHSDWLDDTRSFSRNYQPSLSNCKDWQPVHVPVRMCFLLWLLMYLFIDIILWPLVHDTTLGFIPSISGNLVQGLPIITTYVTRVLQNTQHIPTGSSPMTQETRPHGVTPLWPLFHTFLFIVQLHGEGKFTTGGLFIVNR